MPWILDRKNNRSMMTLGNRLLWLLLVSFTFTQVKSQNVVVSNSMKVLEKIKMASMFITSRVLVVN